MDGSPRDALAERTCIVTGANTGIGRAIARGLASRGARVWLACRSEERARPVLSELRNEFGERSADYLELDLASLASVRRAANAFTATREPLDVLVNNAGVAGARGLTADGFEVSFGVNHLGRFHFTQQLLPRLRDRERARVITVSSGSHYAATDIDFERVRRPTASLTGLAEYETSKLCNVLFTAELARRTEGTGVHAYAVDPGRVASDVWRHVPRPIRAVMKWTMTSTEDGARSTLHCATEPSLVRHSGRYYAPDGTERTAGEQARDTALAARLWAQSDAWCEGSVEVE
jgi:NAD(P)-dependent dehydrogenase (short-subunit alcohol dehydrogenase family)